MARMEAAGRVATVEMEQQVVAILEVAGKVVAAQVVVAAMEAQPVGPAAKVGVGRQVEEALEAAGRAVAAKGVADAAAVATAAVVREARTVAEAVGSEPWTGAAEVEVAMAATETAAQVVVVTGAEAKVVVVEAGVVRAVAASGVIWVTAEEVKAQAQPINHTISLQTRTRSRTDESTAPAGHWRSTRAADPAQHSRLLF